MVVAKISGGLGNQMFQYAGAKALAIRLQEELYLDTSTFHQVIPNVDPRIFELDIFPNLFPRFISQDQVNGFYHTGRWESRLKRLIGLRHKKVFTEIKHGYNEKIGEIESPVLMDGYFQTEKYFKSNDDVIRHQFRFPEMLPEDVNFQVLKDIRESLSVSIHVRRGDYVKYAPTHSFHGVCSEEYYKKSIAYFRELNPGCFFYFFSDEPDWVARNLLQNDLKASLVESNSGRDSWKDMYLMSQCKHNIIANSSFSWWGAWLNSNPEKKVIAPARWFMTTEPFYEPNDIVPAAWIKMNN